MRYVKINSPSLRKRRSHGWLVLVVLLVLPGGVTSPGH